MGQHHPGRDVRGRLSPGVSDEPDVGQHHGEPDQAVETEDHRHALPVGEQSPALSQLVLGLLVVDHADYDQQEAGRYLHIPVNDDLSVDETHLVTAEENGLRPGDSEADQVKLPLLGESEPLAGVDLITGVVVLVLLQHDGGD